MAYGCIRYSYANKGFPLDLKQVLDCIELMASSCQLDAGIFGVHVAVKNPTANVSMMYPIYSHSP